MCVGVCACQCPSVCPGVPVVGPRAGSLEQSLGVVTGSPGIQRWRLQFEGARSGVFLLHAGSAWPEGSPGPVGYVEQACGCHCAGFPSLLSWWAVAGRGSDSGTFGPRAPEPILMPRGVTAELPCSQLTRTPQPRLSLWPWQGLEEAWVGELGLLQCHLPHSRICAWSSHAWHPVPAGGMCQRELTPV